MDHSDTPVASAFAAHSIVVITSTPPLELPEFDGKPTSWASFYRSVQQIMADQGGKLSENAKWTQLLKAMSHPDARRVQVLVKPTINKPCKNWS